MAKKDEVPEGVFDDREAFLESYRPLQRAWEALRALYDNPEFRKRPEAIEVAYALGALEEDVDGGAASELRDRAAAGRRTERIVQLLPLVMGALEQYMKILRPSLVESSPIAGTWTPPSPPHGFPENYWTECHPMYNGDHRAICKICGHPRCGAAADLPSGA